MGFNMPMGQLGFSAYKKAEPRPMKSEEDEPSDIQQTRAQEYARSAKQTTYLGPSLAVRPSDELPVSKLRGEGGKFTSNPEYQKSLEQRRVWNDTQKKQYDVQMQGVHRPEQFKDFVPLRVPGRQQTPAKYLPNTRSGVINQQRQTKINKERRNYEYAAKMNKDKESPASLAAAKKRIDRRAKA